MIDIKVPTVGESISEVTLLKWTKKDGDYVDRDEVIAELESEKATFEVNAEKAGLLKTSAKEGDTLKIGDTLASIDEAAAKPEAKAAPAVESKEPVAKTEVVAPSSNGAAKPTEAKVAADNKTTPPADNSTTSVKATPVASAIIADKKVNPSSITASGANGKILKDDVLAALSSPGRTPGAVLFSRNDKPEKMSNLRKTISRRLVEAKKHHGHAHHF